MESNAGDDGAHFQSYPFDFLEFLNHQRFDPMEPYGPEGHPKALPPLPCPQPPFEYPPPPQFDRPPPAKLKDFKADNVAKKNEVAAAGGAAPTGTPPSYTAAPPAPPNPSSRPPGPSAPLSGASWTCPAISTSSGASNEGGRRHPEPPRPQRRPPTRGAKKRRATSAA